MAPSHDGSQAPGRVAIAGASGFIGRALSAHLAAAGWHVQPLVRRAPTPGRDEIRWMPAQGEVDAAALEGVDVVVNLAGEKLTAGRWTPARRDALWSSRVHATELLAEALTGLGEPPRLLISASAVGYYGSRGDEVLTEDSPPGEGFLAGLCQAWEAATQPAARAGIRVVQARFGLVLGPGGGSLPLLARPFSLGVGAVLGDGGQYLSWVALEDAVRALAHAMDHEALAGPVNVVAPAAVTNAELSRALGRVLRRPVLLRLPAPIVRLMFGEMGQEVLLASTRVRPGRLLDSGFSFAQGELEGALRQALARPGRSAPA